MASTSSKLIDLISDVYTAEEQKRQEHVNNDNYNPTYERYRMLNTLLRKSGHWPYIQVKYFSDKSGLVLMYNAYKNYDNNTIYDDMLYKESRSVVINLESETPGGCIVTTISNEIPTRVTDKQYESTSASETAALEAGYEGTMINVYNHNKKWYFSTTSCPNIDTSRYFHPTKTHGMMFDEILQDLFPYYPMQGELGELGEMPENHRALLRERFTSHLDANKSYLFVLVHHDNKHVIDYTPLFGEKYKELFHISTRSKSGDESNEDQPYAYIGVKYPERFASVDTALQWLRSSPTNYAVIAKKQDNTLFKVCREEVVFHEETDLGNANPWQNMLWIFLKKRHDFTVADYARSKQYKPVKTESGKVLSPTFVIHTAVSVMTEYLYNLYHTATYYNPKTHAMSFQASFDKNYAPIMRFHLVQLRNIQKKNHADNFITQRMITDYLRYHQTIRNIRLLIKHFAENPISTVQPEQQFCITKLNEMLRDWSVQKDKQSSTEPLDEMDCEMEVDIEMAT